MSDMPPMSNEEEPQPVLFSEIDLWKYFSMQPEGFILQKVSAIHYLPVSVRCKYRAFLMDQKEKVFPRKRFA